MKNNIAFGTWEATTILINLLFVQAVLTFPREMVLKGGTTGWVIPIITTALGIVYFSIVAYFYRKIGSKDLLDISRMLGGKTIEIIVGVFLSAVLVIISSLVLNGFAHIIKGSSLNNSPVMYIFIFFLIGMVCCCYAGIEANARISAILVPILIFSFIVITIGLISRYDINNLFPVLGNGVQPILVESLSKISIFSPVIIILLFMVPYFSSKYIKRVSFLTVGISGVILIWSVLSFILTFPYEAAITKKMPLFQMARLFEFGNFISRIESVYVLITSIAGLMYLGTTFTFAVNIFAKALGLKHKKAIIPAFALITVSLALFPISVNASINDSIYFNVIFYACIFLPLILFVLVNLKSFGKKGDKTDEG